MLGNRHEEVIVIIVSEWIIKKKAAGLFCSDQAMQSRYWPLSELTGLGMVATEVGCRFQISWFFASISQKDIGKCGQEPEKDALHLLLTSDFHLDVFRSCTEKKYFCGQLYLVVNTLWFSQLKS